MLMPNVVCTQVCMIIISFVNNKNSKGPNIDH